MDVRLLGHVGSNDHWLIYKTVRLSLSSKRARAAELFSIFIDEKIKDEVDTRSQMLATKEDLRIEVSRSELKVSDSKAELIK